MKYFGITGTNGKTSICAHIGQLAAQAAVMHITDGTFGIGNRSQGYMEAPYFNNDSDAYANYLECYKDLGAACITIEAYSAKLKWGYYDAIHFDVIAFTSLGEDHLDVHSSLDDYKKAKLSLIDQVQPSGRIIILKSSNFYNAVIKRAAARGINVISIDFKGINSPIAIQSSVGENHKQLLAILDNFKAMVRDLQASFQHENALLAICAAYFLFDVPKGCTTDFKFKEVPGRCQKIYSRNAKTIMIDYAHSSDSLKAILTSCREQTLGRLLLIFGCGGDRYQEKRPLMGKIAHTLADLVIVTDDEPRAESKSTIRSQILAACPSAIEIEGRDKAIAKGISLMQKDDFLLIAGMGAQTYAQAQAPDVLVTDAQLVLRALNSK